MTTTIQQVINVAAQTILDDWRQATKTDDAILREKLMECGWRYRRTNGGGWHHPDAPGHPSPKTLEELAKNLAGYLAQKEFDK